MNKQPFWLTLGAWFMGLTGVYWILCSLGLGADFGGGGTSTGLWITNLIGLFVPVGPGNSIVIFSFLFRPDTTVAIYMCGFSYLLLFLCTLTYGEKWLQSLNFSPIVKIILNLGILLLLSAVLDFAMFNSWAAMELFISSLVPSYEPRILLQ
jgi:hypothetical protein